MFCSPLLFVSEYPQPSWQTQKGDGEGGGRKARKWGKGKGAKLRGNPTTSRQRTYEKPDEKYPLSPIPLRFFSSPSPTSFDVQQTEVFEVGCLTFDKKIRLRCRKHNGKRFSSLPQHFVWFVPTRMNGLLQNVYVPLNFRLEFPKSDLPFTFHPQFPKFPVK